MTPEVSRAVGLVKASMLLEPGPLMDELVTAAQSAASPADLPAWAVALLGALGRGAQ